VIILYKAPLFCGDKAANLLGGLRYPAATPGATYLFDLSRFNREFVIRGDKAEWAVKLTIAAYGGTLKVLES